MGLDVRQHFLLLEGLDDIIDRAAEKHLDLVEHLVRRADESNGNVMHARIGAAAVDFLAVHVWHHGIHQDHVWQGGLPKAQRHAAAVGWIIGVPAFPEHLLEQPEIICNVVNH